MKPKSTARTCTESVALSSTRTLNHCSAGEEEGVGEEKEGEEEEEGEGEGERFLGGEVKPAYTSPTTGSDTSTVSRLGVAYMEHKNIMCMHI